MLPLLGFTDDAALLATAIRMVASHITPDIGTPPALRCSGASTAGVDRHQAEPERFRPAGYLAFSPGGTCARAFCSASLAWNCLNSASLSGVRGNFPAAVFCFRKSSTGCAHGLDLALRQAMSWRRKRCQSGNGADSETSFDSGWNGGFWKVGNFVKKLFTNSASFDSARCWAPNYRPPAPRAPQWCHLWLILNQVGIVLRRQACRQIVALQRLGIVDGNEMQPVILDLAHGLGRLALIRNHGIDLAGPQFLQRHALLI